jgi:hypothetical protein
MTVCRIDRGRTVNFQKQNKHMKYFTFTKKYDNLWKRLEDADGILLKNVDADWFNTIWQSLPY